MIKAAGSRVSGTVILAGGMLFLLASVLHPPAANPWSGMRVLPRIIDSPVYWQFDVLFTGLFAFGIAAGDFAMLLAWLAVVLLGIAALKLSHLSHRLAIWGIILGGLGAAGIAIALLLPEWSLPILLITSGPAFIWVMIFGWNLYDKDA